MSIKEILIVDDEIGIRELLSEILFDEGYRVHVAENAEQARKIRARESLNLVLLDIWMPDTDGLTLLKEWVGQGVLTMPVIMMSGHGTIDTALEAIKIGATDFLEKPISLQKLLKTIAHATQPVVAVAAKAEIPAKPLPSPELPFSLDLPLREAREQFDSLYLNYQIQKENGNIARVAEAAGMERTHLYRKLKQLGIKIG